MVMQRIVLIKIILDSGKFQMVRNQSFYYCDNIKFAQDMQSEKLLHLTDIYESGQEQAMERALSGLILNLHYYNGRILLYPEISARVSQMSKISTFREHCRIIILQTIRSRETEKLSRKLHEEILPQVAKLKPRIEDKLDLDNILPKDKSEEKNPDWSEMFSGSEEIFKTMEELTKLQMEGADVYMSAFCQPQSTLISSKTSRTGLSRFIPIMKLLMRYSGMKCSVREQMSLLRQCIRPFHM